MPAKYAAFISYKHAPDDRIWAKWISSQLEGFRIPDGIDGVEIQRFGRIFRDDEEASATTDLGEELRRALRDSDALIVVCSPRAKGSHWISEEIAYFRNLGRGDRVFALLIEGDPDTSFPQGLIALDSNAQPLAADVRPRTDEPLSETKRRAFLKIAAGVLNCSFDALEQREARRARKLRRRWAIASFAAAFVLLSAYAGILLQQTRDLNRERSTFLAQIAQRETDAAQTVTDLDVGEYERAIRIALMATRQGPLYPESSAATEELIRALQFAPNAEQINQEEVNYFARSPAGSAFATLTFDGQLDLYDASILQIVARNQIDVPDTSALLWHPTLPALALSGEDGQVRLVRLTDGTIIYQTPPFPVVADLLSFSSDGRYMLVGGSKVYDIWDLSNGQRVIRQQTSDLREAMVLPYSLNVLTWEDDGLFIRNLEDGQVIHHITTREERATQFIAEPSGQRMFVHVQKGDITSGDYVLRTVALPDFSVEAEIPALGERAVAMAVSLDQSLIYLTHDNQNILGNAQRLTILPRNPNRLRRDRRELVSPEGGITKVIPLPQVGDFMTLHSGGSIRFWPSYADEDKPFTTLVGHDGGSILNAFQPPEGPALITFGDDGDVINWDYATRQNVVGRLPMNAEPVGFHIAPDGQSFLAWTNTLIRHFTRGEDKSFNWTDVLSLSGSSRSKIALAHPFGDDTFVAAAEHGEVVLIGPEQQLINSHRLEPFDLISKTSDKGLFATSGSDGVHIFGPATDYAPSNLGHAGKAVSKLVFSPDDALLGIGFDEGSLEILSTDTWDTVYTADGFGPGVVADITFMPDGSIVAFAAEYGVPQIVDLSSGVSIAVPEEIADDYKTMKTLQFDDTDPVLLMTGRGRFTSFGNQVSQFNLETGTYDFLFTVGTPVDALTPFAGTDRYLVKSSFGSHYNQIVSRNGVRQLAAHEPYRFGGRHTAIFPDQDMILVSGYRTIDFWDVTFATEPDVTEVRRMACDWALSANARRITERDARAAPILQDSIGQDVCVDPGWNSLLPWTTADLELEADDIGAFIDRLPVGTPQLTSTRAAEVVITKFGREALFTVAEEGHEMAGVLLAGALWLGLGGFEPDIAAAEAWYRSLAVQSLLARQNLAALLEDKADARTKEARALIESAAEEGFWISNRLLGLEAQDAGNAAAAIAYFRRAIDAGDGASALYLAALTDADDCDLLAEGARHGNHRAAFFAADCLGDREDADDTTDLQQRLLVYATQQDADLVLRRDALRALAKLD